MKKINYFAAVCSLMAIFAFSTSCQKEKINNLEDTVPAGYRKVTLDAGIDTKINGDINGGIKWNSKEESIGVFYTLGGEMQTVAQFKKTSNTGGTSPTGTFEGTVVDGDDLLFKYAVFPYNTSSVFKDGRIETNMSYAQAPINPDGLTSNSALAGKIDGTTVTLSPACAYMKINLPVTGISTDGERKTTGIKNIVIKGTRTSDDNSKTASFMSGPCYINFDPDGKPTASSRYVKDRNYDYILLQPKTVEIENWTVYCGGTILCPIFPGTYSYLSFELKDLEDKTVGFFEVNNTNTFTRGLAKNLGTLYYPYIKTGTIDQIEYGTRTLSAEYDQSNTLTLTGSSDAFTGHPATLSSYEFGFEAWAGDTQLDDIICTSAEAKNGGESVDFAAVSIINSVTRVKAYAKVIEGDKVYGEEIAVSRPKEVRTVTFNFTDGKFTTETFTKDTYTFVYDEPEVGDYKCIDDKGDKSDAFPTLSYKYYPVRLAQIKKWDGAEWNNDSNLTTSTAINILGASLTRVQGDVSYTLHFAKGQYTRCNISAGGNGDLGLMLASNYCIELPAFEGFKLTKVICSNPATAAYYARVVNDPATTVGKATGATVAHQTGDWTDIFETEVPIDKADAGTVQYLKINSQCRMPYFILEYTEE